MQQLPEMRSRAAGALTTWKEIADYLNVGVRTAQTWEKELGLPVRRITEGPRGRVVSRTVDLDQWRIERLSRSANPPKRRRTVALMIVGTVAVLACCVYLLAALRQPAPANSFETSGKVLTVSDMFGHVLWRYTFASRLLESAYRSDPTRCTFADLDGNGRLDTL